MINKDNLKQEQIKIVKQQCDLIDEDIWNINLKYRILNAGNNWEFDNYYYHLYQIAMSNYFSNQPLDIKVCFEYFKWIMKVYHNNRIVILDDKEASKIMKILWEKENHWRKEKG